MHPVRNVNALLQQLVADCIVTSPKYIDLRNNDANTANDIIWASAIHRDLKRGNVTKMYHAAVLAALLGMGPSIAGTPNLQKI